MDRLSGAIGISYSQRGSELSQGALAGARSTLSACRKKEALDKAFATIIEDTHTSADEKALAQMGLLISSREGIPDKFSAQSKLYVMSAIAQAMSIAGPIIPALLKVATDAVETSYSLMGKPVLGKKDDTLRAKGLQGAFRALAASQLTTDAQKGIARLGMALDAGSPVTREICWKAMHCIIDALAKPLTGPVCPAVAAVARDMLTMEMTSQDRAGLCATVLRALVADEKAGEKEKAGARLGLDILSSREFDEDRKKELSDFILSRLSSPSSALEKTAPFLIKLAKDLLPRIPADASGMKLNVIDMICRAISENAGATKSQQIIAEYGIEIHCGASLSSNSGLAVYETILNALENESAYRGNKKNISIQLAQDATTGTIPDEDKAEVLRITLKGISEQSGRTSLEQALAELGTELEPTDIATPRSSIIMRKFILDTLRNASRAPIPRERFLAQVLSDAAKAAIPDEDALALLNEGLTCLADRDDATGQIKLLLELVDSLEDDSIHYSYGMTTGSKLSVTNSALDMLKNLTDSRISLPELVSEVCLDTVKNGMPVEDSRILLEHGFEVISENAESDSIEEALAKLGRAIGDSGAVIDRYAMDAKTTIMDALNRFSRSPVSAVRIVSEAAGNLPWDSTDWVNAGDCLDELFEAVSESKLATKKEKAIAGLGAALSSRSVDDESAAMARFSVMRTLSQCASSSKPIAAWLADASMEAIKSLRYTDSMTAILNNAFDYISESPDTPAKIRKLAEEGLEAEAPDGNDAEDTLQAKIDAMNKLEKAASGLLYKDSSH